MKITVISDTHMPRRAQVLPQQVVKSIQKTDAIIHAGDYTSVEILNYLESMGHFAGVAGNNDGPEILIRLGRRKIIEINGYKMGIMHGEGFHSTTVNRVKQAFAKDKVDIVIFGHSHVPFKQYENGVLYFNPGSPTDRRRSPKFSFGEITLGKTIKADLIYF